MSLSSLAMMYIFRWGMIHSAVASIYNCLWPTWVEQTDVSLQAGHESDSLLNQDTAYLISFTNHFTSNDSYLQSLWPLPRCPPHTHTPPPSLTPRLPAPLFLLLLLFFLLSAAQRQLWKEKWQHHTEEPNNCLHCWNSCSTSWFWPHLADSQRTHKPFPRCMKIICTVLLSSHFTSIFYHW